MSLEANASRVSTATEGAPSTSAGAAYAWYVVTVLTLCYMLSFVDRLILSLLVGPIKRDLVISDTRVGLLQGLAFALFYTLAGLPIGRLVDTRNRRTLVMAGVAVWSVFTSGCSRFASSATHHSGPVPARNAAPKFRVLSTRIGSDKS